MTSAGETPKNREPGDATPGHGPAGGSLFERHRWIVFVVPFVLYMLLNALEPPAPPKAPDKAAAAPAKDEGGFDLRKSLGIEYRHYPLVYALKIALVTACMLALCWGSRQFPFSVTPLALLLGALGAVVWVALCRLGLESRILGPLGLGSFVDIGARSAFNPFVELKDQPLWAYGFLAVRFFGLVLVVPVIEEFFLRGFLMRYLTDADWEQVPFGAVSFTAIGITTTVAVAMHPAELVAELVWFSIVTWLMLRTRNIWDCVAAHAVTNLLLGVYVVSSGEWHLM